jgi:hypothetical protein
MALDHSHHMHMLLTQAPGGGGIHGCVEERAIALPLSRALWWAGDWIGEDTSKCWTRVALWVGIGGLEGAIGLANEIREFASQDTGSVDKVSQTCRVKWHLVQRLLGQLAEEGV